MKRKFVMLCSAAFLSLGMIALAGDEEVTVQTEDGTEVTIERDAKDVKEFAAVYKDDDFNGEQRRFEVGKYPNLDDDWEKEIRSIQLMGDIRVILFDEEDFEGQSLIIEQDSADLDELNFKGRAESMIVESLP
jgi:hypothetical protein